VNVNLGYWWCHSKNTNKYINKNINWEYVLKLLVTLHNCNYMHSRHWLEHLIKMEIRTIYTQHSWEWLGYRLDDAWITVSFVAGLRDFSLLQKCWDHSVTHPAYFLVGNGGSFLNGTWGLGHAANHPHPSTVMAKHSLPHIPSRRVQGKVSLLSGIKNVN